MVCSVTNPTRDLREDDFLLVAYEDGGPRESSPAGAATRPRASVAAAAQSKLRELILCGELSAGEAISQVQLAHAMGISRTPLREALRALEREGLVDAPPRRKVRVAQVSPGAMDELYGMRIVNEALGIQVTAPGMTAEDDQLLRDTLAAMDEYSRAHDFERWEEVHNTFHARLVAGAGERIQRQYTDLYEHSLRYRRLYARQDPRAWPTGSADHQSIAEACFGRDGDTAATELALHLSRTALMVLAHIAPEHDPIHVRMAVRIVTRRGDSRI
jgi:DNA-binding GntR family transcriptional regulator